MEILAVKYNDAPIFCWNYEDRSCGLTQEHISERLLISHLNNVRF